MARSTFASEKTKNTSRSEHFWKLRCRKSARRCGAKHISKLKCTRHNILGPLLEVEMSKKCTPLWREAHVQNTPHVRSTFGSWDVEKVHAVVARSTFRTVLGPLLEVEMSKKCTPLWREAHFEVKMYKTHSSRTTFGSWDVEKVHCCGANHISISKCTKHTSRSEHFWKLRCRKSARRCGAKQILKSKSTQHTRFGPLFEVEMSKKCTPLWREAHFEVKMLKTPGVRTTFGRSDVMSRGRRKGLCTLSKVSKTWGFWSISKNHGRRGTFAEDLQRCLFRGRRSTRDIFIKAVRRSGRWFPEKGCILEHQIFKFAEMILRDRCRTSCDLASLFRGRRSSLDRWTGKSQNTLVRGRQLCTQLSIFERSLAELLRFWCCQLGKMRKCRRIASFLTLSTSNTEEVSQNCCVFDVVKFKTWGRLSE